MQGKLRRERGFVAGVLSIEDCLGEVTCRMWSFLNTENGESYDIAGEEISRKSEGMCYVGVFGGKV